MYQVYGKVLDAVTGRGVRPPVHHRGRRPVITAGVARNGIAVFTATPRYRTYVGNSSGRLREERERSARRYSAVVS